MNISDSLPITIAKSTGLVFPAEFLEFSIDQVLDEGIFKDIPFVGWIAKGVSVSRSISDRIFYHKILRFLFTLESISSGDREVFRKKVLEDSDYRKKVGEHLIVLIDKIDNFEKSSLLAKCFDHFITSDITHDYFIDLSHVVERSTLSDLKALCGPDSRRIVFGSSGVAVASGIIEFGISEPIHDEDSPQLGTKLSHYGKDLRDMFLERYRDREKKVKIAKEQSGWGQA